MSVTQASTEQQETRPLRCTRCGALLPSEATFCGQCGERVNKRGAATSSPSNIIIEERYRITSLVHRYAQAQIFLAIDTQLQQPVVIRNLDISNLDEEERAYAIEAAQNEYDLLRQQKILDVLTVIDLRYFEGHLYTVARWPHLHKQESSDPPQTLHDLLQSGIGLPDEEIALTWGYRLGKALAQLHQHDILIGNLDPYGIAINGTTYDGLPALLISWIPQDIRLLLHTSTTSLTHASKHFSAPEVFEGKLEPRSDVYSLGAILYLLLTGSAPVSHKEQIRPLRELNPAIRSGIEQVVMRALAGKPEQRFPNVTEFAEILLSLCSSTIPVRLQSPTTGKNEPEGRSITPSSSTGTPEEQEEDDAEAVTVKVTPMQAQMAHLYLSQLAAQEEEQAHQKKLEQEQQSKNTALVPVEQNKKAELSEVPTQALQERATQLFNTVRQQLSGVLPALPRKPQAKTPAPADKAEETKTAPKEDSLLKRLQRFLLGEQQHSITAAAIIETPLRIQPNQNYAIRIHLIGRDGPPAARGAKKGETATGLSGLSKGEIVHIEVRSALYQNYAYIVQRADVHMPNKGYAAEVNIPMQPMTEGPSGRRERLHVFFMDDLRRPLYERPFVIEIYVSHLVQSGREGHNALTIPI